MKQEGAKRTTAAEKNKKRNETKNVPSLRFRSSPLFGEYFPKAREKVKFHVFLLKM